MLEQPGERSLVAKQISASRKKERVGGLVKNRSITEYIDDLQGLKHLFQFARTNKDQLGSSTILDIGAGTTRGIFEASISSYGKGLNFTATVLRHIPEIEKYLGKDRTRVTSAETLRGINDRSCSVVLSDFGLGYSQNPEASIKSVDRVLVPGGILKVNFRYAPDPYVQDFGETALFVNELKKLGYDVYVKRNERTYTEVVVAIKPGNKISSAEELTNLDLSDWEEQKEEISVEFEGGPATLS